MGYFGTFRAHEGAGAGGGGTHRPGARALSPRARAHTVERAVVCAAHGTARNRRLQLDVANENEVVTRLPALP